MTYHSEDEVHEVNKTVEVADSEDEDYSQQVVAVGILEETEEDVPIKDKFDKLSYVGPTILGVGCKFKNYFYLRI